jgi:hypothetical protein
MFTISMHSLGFRIHQPSLRRCRHCRGSRAEGESRRKGRDTVYFSPLPSIQTLTQALHQLLGHDDSPVRSVQALEISNLKFCKMVRLPGGLAPGVSSGLVLVSVVHKQYRETPLDHTTQCHSDVCL